ncbi:16S rRNA (uracil(1498)-N(3))-methyltransferase [Amylibacter kogurei]|uniref:Ribosomal RNA small subunit methyltransferase E n=1 Tax=Paramylibacter kogurei TaxID=1889778 RepID=A0A2G5KAR1_9RHOB|nr:16S rRNA (uracil(1498)-N(3))-methyltransferase [Amylibacter kogurei]PIB26142.1 16S rRNA (uracil(1498)-N(3))-methyltransferase [Amylibacter kogurei]
MNKKANIRLFVDAPMGVGQSVSLNRDQSHYLFGVMRLKTGDLLEIFNGQDGAWLAEIAQAGKRAGELICRENSQPQSMPPDLWLLFAPIKRARTDFIVEKATELGVSQIQPITTDFTNSDKIRQDRLQAHALEAAEQCGGTYVPPVKPLEKLTKLLQDWPSDRQILFCDETSAGKAKTDFANSPRDKWAILIGPEGGFSQAEIERLRGLEFVTSMSLGPRILRADTAAVAAITLWQNARGDWR